MGSDRWREDCCVEKTAEPGPGSAVKMLGEKGRRRNPRRRPEGRPTMGPIADSRWMWFAVLPAGSATWPHHSALLSWVTETRGLDALVRSPGSRPGEDSSSIA